MARGNAAGVGTVGFVLLTHNKPYQAIRLFNTLNRMFNHPPIAWHHDFGLCDLPPDLTTTNAQFVRPHIRTEWGKFSVVDATISALDLLVRYRTRLIGLCFSAERITQSRRPTQSCRTLSLASSTSTYDMSA